MVGDPTPTAMRSVLAASVLLALAGCAADAASESDPESVVGAFEWVDGANVLRAELKSEGSGDYAASVRGAARP